MSSKHFQDKEFACKCGCGMCKVDPRLIDGLEKLRSKLGDKPIIINSGCRCATHNKKCNGKPASLHLSGKAVDVRVPGVVPRQVARVAMTIPWFKRSGIIWYDGGWTHLDVGRNICYHRHCTSDGRYLNWS